MPLSRSNTRSKSRSPVPPTGSQSPRPFLPPSHYALAGGLSNPYASKSNDPSELLSPRSQSSLSSNSHERDSFIPISYPEEHTSTSDSPFGHNPASMISSNSRRAALNAGSPAKRQSHINNLPMLEAHLLPSLRDTINRMTRPPSRAQDTTSSTDAPSDDFSLQSGRARSPSTSSASSSSTASSIRLPPTPQHRSAPKMDSSPKSAITTPTPKPRSALKSALRVPTPKMSVTGPDMAHSSPNLSTTDGSIKEDFEILSTGNSYRNGPISAGEASTVKTKHSRMMETPSTPTTRTGRRRSRTDPGSAKNLPAQPRIPVSPQPPSQKASNIPRRADPSPRANSIKTWEKSNSTDDSDIEYRFAMNSRDKRQLFVMNAEIVPSSSSESEAEAKTPDKRTRLPMLEQGWSGQRRTDKREQTRAAVGLGFGFQGENTKDSTYTKDTKPRILRQDDTIAARMYSDRRHEAEARTEPAPSDYCDSPLGSSKRDGRKNRVDNSGGRSHEVLLENDLDEDHRRRRAALMGIVSGLESSGIRPPTAEDDSLESDYRGQEGLAISGSGDIPAQTQEANADNDLRNRSETINYRAEKSSQIQKPHDSSRSRTLTPIVVVSSEDDHQSRIYSARTATDRRKTSWKSNNNSEVSNRYSEGRKSPSRSPVMRQNEVAPIPAALKKHSVYHAASTIATNSGGQKFGANSEHDTRRDPETARRGYTVTDDNDSVHYSSGSFVEDSYTAAAREKRAFGIPPSESEEAHEESQFGGNGSTLPHADSDLSSVGSAPWQEDCEELSIGAEALFRRISGKGNDRNGDHPYRRGAGEGNIESIQAPSLWTPVSESASLSSVYESPPPIEHSGGLSQELDLQAIRGGWRKNLSPSVYHELTERYGEVEMQRQEVIWELCGTEEEFVDRLNSTVQLFILPLRVRNSKTWISGVPTDVARLLDWLEDIVNLHSKILLALQTAQSTYHAVVERIAAPLVALISRFEVYQPYLVRLVDVASVIQQLLEDDTSDFGEFVKLQQTSEQCGQWKLERFLVEPVNRLAKYPMLFRQLLDLTPKNHADYLPTFSLVHSLNMIIRVMTEVKIREDEYDMVKDISTRIHGLPSSMQLARRERRLITQGLLSRTAEPLGDSQPLQDGALSAHTDNDDPSKRSNRLFEAIHDWDARRGRSDSVKSTTSSATGTSFSSYKTASSSHVPLIPSSPYVSLKHGVISSSPHKQATSHGRLNTPGKLEHPLFTSFDSQAATEAQSTLMHVFVFTDLVLFTVPLQRMQNDAKQKWYLAEGIGISRILRVSTHSEDSTSSVGLELLPTAGSDEAEKIPVDMWLNINAEHADGLEATNEQVRHTWLSAFERCSQFTLQSFSFPYDEGFNIDDDLDTRQSVLAILASGLPFPKSPSVQIEDAQLGHSVSTEREEREERGWWSLRFQQVLRELQRQDLLLNSLA